MTGLPKPNDVAIKLEDWEEVSTVDSGRISVFDVRVLIFILPCI